MNCGLPFLGESRLPGSQSPGASELTIAHPCQDTARTTPALVRKQLFRMFEVLLALGSVLYMRPLV